MTGSNKLYVCRTGLSELAARTFKMNCCTNNDEHLNVTGNLQADWASIDLLLIIARIPLSHHIKVTALANQELDLDL